MKPLRLEFQAFGSYPGREEVDFSLLESRGLFVVAGPTGTGKTTIFDAMAYALFGRLPGNRGADSQGAGKEIRSHHAAADTPTEVVLLFEADGCRYQVSRQPEQLRPKQRGDGMTNASASATLVRVLGDGGTTSEATGAKDVSTRASELLGLDLTQFQRVVLLPQGEFNDFLLAKSDDREKLLQKLFGGEIYDAVTNRLREQAHDLGKQVGKVDEEKRLHLHNARESVALLAETLGQPLEDGPDLLPREVLDERITSLDEPLQVLAEQVSDQEKTAEEAVRVHSRLVEELGRYKRAKDYRDRLADLEKCRPEIEAARKASEDSIAARPLVSAAEEYSAAEARLKDAQRDLDESMAAVSSGFRELGLPEVPVNAVDLSKMLAEQKLQVEKHRVSLELVQTTAAALKSAEQANASCIERKTRNAADLERLIGQHAALEQELSGLQPLATAVSSREQVRKELEAAVETGRLLRSENVALEAARSEADQASERYTRALEDFVATQASRLAGKLEDGAPCPVCGSTEHPDKARNSGRNAVENEEVEALREADRVATAKRSELEANVQRLLGRLGDHADKDAARLAEEFERATEAESEARQAATRCEEIQGSLSECAGARAEHQEADSRLRGESGSAAAVVKQRTEARDEAVAAAAGLEEEVVHAAIAVLDRIESTISMLGALQDAVVGCRTALEIAGSALQKQQGDSRFDSVEQARAVLLATDVESAGISAAEDLRKNEEDLSSRLEELTKSGVPAQAPEPETADTLRIEAGELLAQLQASHTTARNAADSARSSLQAHDRVAEGSRELCALYDRVQRASQVCRGNGVLKTTLKRWVLSAELDRVTAAANVHLQRMTTHRYRIRRVGETFGKGHTRGLELQVLDSHTGRARSTATLSGGEQFQASLSLALGLADVVSQGGTASGRRFEALFVDEGFGSLDPEALDEAIEALQKLQATGRMVGTITHVETMKQQLHLGIEVQRLPDGGGSRLVVNP